MCKRILIVDDEPHMTDLLKEALSRDTYEIETSHTAEIGFKNVKKSNFHLVITDVRLPRRSGIDLLKLIKQYDESIGVIVMTAYGTIDSAVEAMKMGAYNYVTKPFTVDEIRLTVSKYFEFCQLKNENKILKNQLQEKYGLDNIIGKSKAMKEVFKTVNTVAQSDCTVLIKGASGTGKELIARAIHAQSPRKNNAFVTTNCAAWPETLIESELFGYVKGAFTGANQDKKGIFEDADGGTILLDEVSELSYNLQAKLLRVLQEKEVNRVGSTESIPVDVRIIATTNRDLKKMVSQGTFREDLFFRLNVVPIKLPELKDKKEDILPLIEHFLIKFSEKNNKGPKGFTNEVKDLFLAYDWPGNVRELENLIERAIVTSANGDLLTTNNFKELVQDVEQSSNKVIQVIEGEPLTLKEVEKRHIHNILQMFKGNKTRAANALGISVRTLRNKFKEYQVEKEKSEAGE